MQTKGHRLSNEILGIQTPKKIILPILDYQSVIVHQQKLIRQLQLEIKYLRQYIRYFIGHKQQTGEGEETDDTSANGNCNQSERCSEQKLKKINEGSIDSVNSGSGIKKLVKEIMTMLEAENIDSILEKLKLVIQKANKKLEPVFVERIKLKQVAVPVQIIKQVQKQVIVYKQRIVYKQVPIFREKIVQRYVHRPPSPLNSSSLTSPMNSPRNQESILEKEQRMENGVHQNIQENKSKQKLKLMISTNRSEWQNKANSSNNSTHNSSSYICESSNNHSHQPDRNQNSNNLNQSYSVKSPRFKQKLKQDFRQRQEYFSPREQDKHQQKSNFYKSPKYKQKDYY